MCSKYVAAIEQSLASKFSSTKYHLRLTSGALPDSAIFTNSSLAHYWKNIINFMFRESAALWDAFSLVQLSSPISK